MNFQDYNELMIDNHLQKGEEIFTFCRASKLKNIQLLGGFMEEWLSTAATMQLKTSGSTGEPKIITVEKAQMLESAKATASFFGFQEKQKALLCLPMTYIAGKMMVVRALYSKLNLICIEPSNTPLKEIPEGMQIDFAPLTPAQIHDTTNSGFIKTILLGGGPVSLELENILQSVTSEIYHGYGMTETLSHVALRKLNGSEKSDMYKGLPGVSFSTDESDCLVIKVPFLNQTIVTNDVVTLFNEHTFVWKGRIDHVINSGAIKLHPESIERKLTPCIRELFFIAALPDEKLGDKLCLFIESESYDDVQIQHLKHEIAKILDKYEIPKEIIFIPKFQYTISGKIQRNKTVEYYKLSKHH